jgi:serine/threonine-protein kinase
MPKTLEEADTVPGGDPEAAARARGDLTPGTAVEEYEVLRLIGAGGCSTVYLARHRAHGRLVALKVLHREVAAKSKMIERFVREVRVVNLLRHPSIVAMFDLGKLEDGRPFCVMEYLPGLTLDGVLRARGRFSPEEALDILEPVGSALQAAHEVGIVHRDVKLGNIAVFTDGPRRVVKLLDFGIAKLTDPEMDASGFTSAGRCIGTLTTMAPEQILGSAVDARADIYSLGVLLFRMLTGRAPFVSSSAVDLAFQHVEAPVPLPSAFAPVQPAVDRVVLKSMEKAPERRFASAESFLDALREAVGRPAMNGQEQTRRSATAVGVGVEVSINAAEEDFDDALIEDLGRVLDASEEAAVREGFAIVLATSSLVLSARALPAAPEPQKAERRRALAAAAALHRRLAERSAPNSRIRVAVYVHVDDAVVRGASSPEVIGGPVTQMLGRYRRDGAIGLHATARALEGLSDVEDIQGFQALDTPPSSKRTPP